MRTELRVYTTKNGKEPFLDWLNKLKDVAARARIRARLDRLALGHYGDSKSITKDIKELRMTFGSGYRIYFTEQDDVVTVLLCGGNKSTQKKRY